MRRSLVGLAMLATMGLTGCGEYQNLASLPLPGTIGGGPGSYTVQAQMSDIVTLQANSRVRVADIHVGTVTAVERQGWNALLTMKIDGNVDLPANATATLGQTSLLGSLHVELAPPIDVPPEGKLRDGALIPLARTGSYPTTEATLSALSLLLNGGGVGQIQEITSELSRAFGGRADELRSLLTQLDLFASYLNDQKNDIIAAVESLNNLVGQLADQKPVVDEALKTIPDALAVLRDERETVADALDVFGQFAALAADSVNQTQESLVTVLEDLGPVLESLANSDQDLTRSLDFFTTYPFPKPTLSKWIRGDYANLTAVVDLTLTRLDSSFLTGTFLEGELTELDLQRGRTIGQLPSPYTARNPLIVPYRFDQGP